MKLELGSLGVLFGLLGCSVAAVGGSDREPAALDAGVYSAIIEHFSTGEEPLLMDPRPIDLRQARLPTVESYLPSMDAIVESRRRVADRFSVVEGVAFPTPVECTHLMAPPGYKRLAGCHPPGTGVVAAGIPSVIDIANEASVRVALVRYHATGFEVALFDVLLTGESSGWYVSSMDMFWHYE
ncbi:MAG: hypothetical protein ACYC28_06720 [Longimicrobiales bacterium]